MKKLVIILVLFVLMSVGAVIDIKLTSGYYGKVSYNLEVINAVLIENSEKLDTDEIIGLVASESSEWKEKKFMMGMLVNHNIIRIIDDRFTTLEWQVRTNNDESLVTIALLRNYIDDLKADNYPIIENIF